MISALFAFVVFSVIPEKLPFFQDVNDNGPQFIVSSYHGNVTENLPPGKLLLPGLFKGIMKFPSCSDIKVSLFERKPLNCLWSCVDNTVYIRDLVLIRNFRYPGCSGPCSWQWHKLPQQRRVLPDSQWWERPVPDQQYLRTDNNGGQAGQGEDPNLQFNGAGGGQRIPSKNCHYHSLRHCGQRQWWPTAVFFTSAVVVLQRDSYTWPNHCEKWSSWWRRWCTPGILYQLE